MIRTACLSLFALLTISSNPVLSQDAFMVIHMDNQKIGSDVWKYWRRVAVSGERLAPSDPLPNWVLRTAGSYFSVYSHYCAPGIRLDTGVPAPGIEVAIYSDQFRVDYGEDCRAFYLGEIVPRLHAINVATVAVVSH